MIWDSWPWKDDLLQRALRLERRITQRRWPEASLAKTEQDIFISAYGIRKLFEADKLSDEVESSSVPVVPYPSTGKTADRMNWHHLDKLYDIENPLPTAKLGLERFCNQIIHSFVFMITHNDENGLAGFFCASDREKPQLVYYVDICPVIDLLKLVARDDVSSAHRIRGAAGEWKSIRKLSPKQAKRASTSVKLSARDEKGLSEYVDKLNRKVKTGEKP